MQKQEYLFLSNTDRPIFGVLADPIKSTFSVKLKREAKAYIPTTHVKFLESAGARVVPISYDLPENELLSLLGKLNGVYIPGENREVMENEQYHKTVKAILTFQQKQYVDEHLFPVAVMNYGLSSALLAFVGHKQDFFLQELKEYSKGNNRIQMLEDPKDSFIFDKYDKDDLDFLLDKCEFYTRIEKGLKLKNFESTPELVRTFVPVAVFKTDNNDEENNRHDLLAVVEGKKLPLFGFAYSPEVSQFAFGTPKETDRSQHARNHAQYIANFIVEEGQRSKNHFNTLEEQQSHLVNTYELALVTDSHQLRKEIVLLKSDS